MSDTHLLVATDEQQVQVRVIGRATFACSQAFLDFCFKVLEQKLSRMALDMSECSGMDSTFMGVMSQVGLKARKHNLKVEIVNASDALKKLLKDLGIQRLFVFSHTTSEGVDWCTLSQTENDDPAAQAEIALRAHETLVEVDPDNMPKFKDVVEYLKQDIARLKSS